MSFFIADFLVTTNFSVDQKTTFVGQEKKETCRFFDEHFTTICSFLIRWKKSPLLLVEAGKVEVAG